MQRCDIVRLCWFVRDFVASSHFRVATETKERQSAIAMIILKFKWLSCWYLGFPSLNIADKYEIRRHLWFYLHVTLDLAISSIVGLCLIALGLNLADDALWDDRPKGLPINMILWTQLCRLLNLSVVTSLQLANSIYEKIHDHLSTWITSFVTFKPKHVTPFRNRVKCFVQNQLPRLITSIKFAELMTLLVRLTQKPANNKTLGITTSLERFESNISKHFNTIWWR